MRPAPVDRGPVHGSWGRNLNHDVVEVEKDPAG